MIDISTINAACWADRVDRGRSTAGDMNTANTMMTSSKATITWIQRSMGPDCSNGLAPSTTLEVHFRRDSRTMDKSL